MYYNNAFCGCIGQDDNLCTFINFQVPHADCILHKKRGNFNLFLLIKNIKTVIFIEMQELEQ